MTARRLPAAKEGVGMPRHTGGTVLAAALALGLCAFGASGDARGASSRQHAAGAPGFPNLNP
jgi:F0F1-type ATP synthase membrane subunit c/vacuolar-type H+-ATPase subunit K